MTTLPHEGPVFDAQSRRSPFIVREMWASMAIAVIWLAVLFDAIFGPDIVTNTASGTNTSTVPSAVPVALFASLATWAVARYGFRKDRD